MERATVRVTGVVQSVGFRPFVYRRAVANDLGGIVRNLGDAGVRIELEGDPPDVDAFLDDLREDPPPLSRIDSIDVDRGPVADPAFERFEIVDSVGSETADVAVSETGAPPASEAGDPGDDGTRAGAGTIPPDTAICDRCLADVRDPTSRYRGYWATSCVDCGPRFTVVESLPFDRPTTSMAAFPMCEGCRTEYEDPADRRYHAQTVACPECGPELRYGTVAGDDATVDRNGATADGDVPGAGRDPFPDALVDTVASDAAIEAAATDLADGAIVAVKGIGGAHLACDATDAGAVATLRERTGRPEKPFAVMVPDLETAASIAALSALERDTLESPRRPIALIESDGDRLESAVAPGLHTVGVMLPYAGVHHLLFDHLDGPLVLTSANRPGRPMLRANGPLVDGLAAVADGFLLHDRRIVARCDDSVARVVDGERRLVRRSRGFAPTPIPLTTAAEDPRAGAASVLAVGPELDATPAVLQSGECYLTQYVGDVDDLETFAYLRTAVEHLLDVTGLDRPPVVAHDAHPEFNTTDYARELVEAGDADRAVAVQHHHAHAASVLAEHDRDRAIALALDGVGYGPDGTAWGGEVLDATLADYERVGGLAPVPMPGGDRATRHPARLAAGLLYAADPGAVEPVLDRHDVAFPGDAEERDLVGQQLEAGVNTPGTSSAGRFLDAVAALLGVCTERTYEGEPAMKLEAVAARRTPRAVDVPRSSADGRPVVDTPRLFAHLVDLLADGASDPTVAATAQDALARGLADLAVEAAEERDREAVALSGGVAYNDHVARRVRERVSEAGLQFLTNERVPPGDGGIAYGQAAVAAARERP